MQKRRATWAAVCLLTATAGLCQQFDVASVKLYQDRGTGPRNSHSTWGPQGVDFSGRSLAFLVAEAYNFQGGRIIGPNSLTKESLWAPLQQGYDIVARADHAVPRSELRLMLRALLADRFQLKLHRESQIQPVYKLVVARDGPKLEESHQVEGDFSMAGSADGFVFRNAEMARLAALLSSQVDRMVVDATGLTGIYNFTLKKAAEPRKQEGISPDSQSPGAFAGALKQLGLQLIADKAPVEYLVIDHVEKPTEN